MAQVASDMGLAADKLLDFSEDQYQMRGFLERLIGSPVVVTQMETIEEDLPGAIIKEVQKLDEGYNIALIQSVIHAAYEQGNMVIVGRGGQAILKGKPGVLHVRVTAPLEQRVARLTARANYSLGGAQDKAIKHDRASADYLKRFYQVDWADPLLYGLVINTGVFEPHAAAQLIAQAVQSIKS
jgi:cytidylate kinase